MWDTCREVGWSPVILSSTVNIDGCEVTVMVPPAVVLTPFSLKVNPAGVGVATGVVTTGLGEGDGEEPVPVEPQAAAITSSAASATGRINPEISVQVGPWALPVKVT